MEKNKRAIFVSGATSGIGFSIAQKYLSEGCFVVINFNKGGMNFKEAKKILNKKNYIENTDFIFLRADISNEESLKKSLSTLEKSILNKIEVLINNAGMLRRSSLNDLKQQDWIDVFNVNVFGVIFLSKLLYKKCPKLNNIINIGSIRGMSPITRINNAAYSISKSTIPALTALQAKTYGPKVRVNAILPGTIDTPQRQGITTEERKIFGEDNSIIPRLGKPEEIAEMCFFITSNKIEYMTGSSIVVDGGYNINYIR